MKITSDAYGIISSISIRMQNAFLGKQKKKCTNKIIPNAIHSQIAE